MDYRKLTALEISGLDRTGIVELYVSVDSDGRVGREVGIDGAGMVRLRFPSEGRWGARGLFDCDPFPSGWGTAVDREIFEWFWSQPDAVIE